TKYGLAQFARDQGLNALPHDDDKADKSREESAETAVAFRERLVELGPAYIKLGQLLSTRSDLLPETYIRELERLQDNVDPLPFAELAPVIESELGGRVSKLFATFDEEPIGAASLGQVHAATLRDGRSVVVKIQRPNIRQQLADDVEFFRELAQFLADHTTAGQRVDLVGIIRELERALADELDYRVEARNAVHFRRALAEFPRLLAPRVVAAYSTERVLTTERVHGFKITDISPVTRTEIDFNPVADELMRAYLKQIAIDGHFHADPHPGNVFVLLPGMPNPPTPSEIVSAQVDTEAREIAPAPTPFQASEAEAIEAAPIELAPIDVKLALIDFGMTARLSPGMRDASVRVLFGLADDRGDEVADALVQVGEKLRDFDRAKFVNEVTEIVSRSYRMLAADLDAGMILYDVINAAFRTGLRPPPELTLLAMALANLGNVARALDPGFEPLRTVRSFTTEIAAHRTRSQFNPRQLYRVATESADLLSTLPRRIDTITRKLANNELKADLELPQIGALIKGLQKVANRVFTGLVLAGLLVASAMLLPERRVLGTAGFLIAAALGIYMVMAILLSDRRAGHTKQ
ncbi:MAG TPA: AarF/UbiB family protein, partial [Gemmatimonadaceae bacterium]|nr:AarF/UbiB family protein [Gemmatimonadaceae bacterium]